MNKQELIKAIAEAQAISKSQVESMLSGLEHVVSHELASGSGEVTLPGIGKLKTSERAARTGRNPQTGATVEVAAKTVVKFTVAKVLKDAVAA